MSVPHCVGDLDIEHFHLFQCWIKTITRWMNVKLTKWYKLQYTGKIYDESQTLSFGL